MTHPVDVAVIGGGPAGSTVAGLLKRQRPEARVCLFEGAEFPRYHVGESLIIENNVVLRELGVLDRVVGAGFERKGGATFVWGRDRTPWALEFHEGAVLRPSTKDALDHAWHVERSRYDEILLDHARALGVLVHQPARVLAVESSEGVARLRVDEGGAERTVTARFVVDAGGRSSILAREHANRLVDPVLRNVAVHGYFEGAELDPGLFGPPSRRRIAAVAARDGWIWMIPLSETLSVGHVTSHRAHTSVRSKDLEAHFLHCLRATPEVQRVLASSRLRPGAAGGKSVRVEANFNYVHDRLVGPDWALLGDAAGFVDPIFSVGVLLAQSSARLLASSLASVLFDDSFPLSRPQVLRAYEQHVHAQLASFRAMARAFYSFNRSKEEFWADVRALAMREGQAFAPDDRSAFLAKIFGFGVNLPVVEEAASCFGKLAGPQIARQLGGQHETGSPGSADPQVRHELVEQPQVDATVVPRGSAGGVLPMAWVSFGAGGNVLAEFPRHIIVPRPLVPLLVGLSRPASLAELMERAASLEGWSPGYAPEVRRMWDGLRGLGALRPVVS